MKKVITLALCAATVCSLSAQKSNVDAAKKLSGKVDKIEEARSLIKAAMENPETANDANTYYIAGKIEFDAFDKGFQQGMINPQAPEANPLMMAEELLNGYNYFLKALPLDEQPNEKGEVKPKYTKDIQNRVAGHATDFFRSGADLYEAQKFYPEAYTAFLTFAEMPDAEWLGSKAPKLNDTDRGQAYFNAALCAYSGNQLLKAADAFRASRQHGYDDENHNGYIYEIACWQNLAQNDSTMADTAKKRIFDVAKEGYDKFGISQPLFLNNLVNTYVQDGDFSSAINAVNGLLADNPDNSNLYGLLGFIYDRQDNDQASLDAYGKAASLPDCDYETLKNAAKKYLRVGTAEFNKVEPNNREGKLAVKAKYFEPANEIAQRAKSMNQDDPDLDYVVENIEYALQTYF